MTCTFVLAAAALLASPDRFAAWLDVDVPIADGFAGTSTADGHARATAHGRVAAVDARGAVTLDHAYYENHERKEIRSIYAPLATVAVKPGDVVRRGQALGAVRSGASFTVKLHAGRDVELRPFLRTHRTLFVPQEEERLVLVDVNGYALRLYERGRAVGTWDVGFGQAKGAKEQRGDNRTPLGMYFVVDRVRGEIPGEFGRFYGGHWVKLNYPNRYDAERGRAAGWLDVERARRIADAWSARKLTDQKTRLGGGIGFHGWAGPWQGRAAGRPDDAHLSWGCVVMHNEDIAAVFDRLPVRTMVVLF